MLAQETHEDFLRRQDIINLALFVVLADDETIEKFKEARSEI